MARAPNDSSANPSPGDDRNSRQPTTENESVGGDDNAVSEVGYGQPPKRHQWKKGQSGNRAGRKKGSKNKRTIIIELMEQKLGRKIEDISKLSRYEGVLLKGIQKALAGDTKAMAFILRRYDDAEVVRSCADPVPTEQDETVYAALVEKIKIELSEVEQ